MAAACLGLKACIVVPHTTAQSTRVSINAQLVAGWARMSTGTHGK